MSVADRTADTVEEAVANGIALLDAHGPPGWRDRITIDLISFPSPTLCPLGQVYGQFGVGITALRTAADAMLSSGDFGFMHREPHWFADAEDRPDGEWSCAELALAWQTALTQEVKS